MSTASKPRRRAILAVLVLLGLAGGAYLGWRFWPRTPPTKSDTTAAMHANLRGVGHMERFDYAPAVQAFEEALGHAPDWTPAKVNLAIALLNTNRPETRQRARVLLGETLMAEPDHPYAHYCLGIIDLYENQLPAAYAHFEKVSQLDPRDAHTWFHMGMTHPKGKESAEAKKCFVRALKLNPYLNAARYNVAQHPVDRDEKLTLSRLSEFNALTEAQWESPCALAYAEMGRYAEVIGRAPAAVAAETGPPPMFDAWKDFQVRLGAGTTWARATDLSELTRAVKDRFGATVVLLDFNRDGRPDLFLASAVVRGGAVRDLLLRNDGDGGFTDVTVAVGLGTQSLGAAAADYDNDGKTDLLLTGVGAPRLYRNLGDKFENLSPGWQGLDGVFLGASWVDLDQDGDLDLLVARYAESAPAALTGLASKGKTSGAFVVLLNVGEALLVKLNEPGGLATKFQRWQPPDGLDLSGAAVGAIVSDLDGDRDLDWLLLADGKPATAVWNDRLLRFRLGGTLGDAQQWNGGLVLDVNHDQRSDLVLLPQGKPPQLWLSRSEVEIEKLADGFVAGTMNAPVLLQAQAVDVDRDGWTDVVGLSAERRPVMLQNDSAGKLVQRADYFGPADALPQDLRAALTADLDGDGTPDLLLLSESAGLQARRNRGNGNQTLRLDISGKRSRGTSLRSNADGVGTWVVAQAGTLWTGLERATTQAGLGQSMLPIELGLGKYAQADVVRLRWPDGIPQAELNVATGVTKAIPEVGRKPVSCPVLFAWDGQRYRFVTDLLGGGALGELGADGKARPPRPEESLKLEPGMLVPQDGWYRLKIAEPMDEVLYLDWLELLVVEHRAEWNVYPDERFVMAGPPPTQQLLFLTELRPPLKARTSHGDVTELVRDRDRRMTNGFRTRSWMGYAEEHTLELDFGPPPANKPGERILALHGWTDYPFPESIFAAQQAGVELLPPQLEVFKDGKWQGRGELGFPAGLPRTMTRDVSALVTEGAGRLRLRTNMQVYWDQVLLGRRIAEAEALAGSRRTSLPVGRATLRQRGFAQEVSPDGSGAISYDDDRSDAVAISKWKGRLTRLGEVAELLQRRDDCFVLCGPGDEIEIGFDGRNLPALPQGWTRSLVLRTAGYTKDASPFTLTGGVVGPLPSRAMSNYPPDGSYKPSAEIAEYDRRWNSRTLGR